MVAAYEIHIRKEFKNMDLSQANGKIIEAGEVNFESEVLQSKPPVLVAFLAPWSRPCQMFRAVLEEVATAFAGTVRVVQVNADDNPDLGVWYEIQSIPTLLYFVNGSLRARIVGTASKAAILSKMQSFPHDHDFISLVSGHHKK